MKPNFALDLSHDGISLLHRGVEGWHTVGTVTLEDAEFSEKLGYMRQTAAALESGGVTTKLVIPNSQIKFISLEADATTDADCHDQVRSALEGATPYDIEDLVYDWSVVDGTLHIAAVARETLAEAEGFADEYGFNPLSFVATPAEGSFSKTEPFFGTSKASQTLLDKDDPVEPDGVAIRRLGPAMATEKKLPIADPEPATAEPLPSDPLPPATPQVTAPQLPPLEEQTPETPAPTFTSRRPPTKEADDHQALDRIEKIESRLAILPEGTASLAPKLGGASRKVIKDTPDPTPQPPVTKPKTSEKPATKTVPTVVPVAPAPPPAAAPEQTAKQPPLEIPPPPAPVLTAGSEAQAMTVFGARKKPTQRGKPRYLGLSLMLLLMVVLGGIVLWSTFFLGDEHAFWRSNQTDKVITASAPEMDTDAAVNNALALLTEPTIRRPTPPQTTELDPVDLTGAQDAQILAPAPLLDAPTPLTPQEAEAAYQESGIWQLAPPLPVALHQDDINTLYVTSADPQINSQDAIALPHFPPSSADASLELQSSPAAHSAAFVLDERGLVIPSAEGTLTPEGVRVFAGPPPVKPVARGNRVPQVTIEPDLRLAAFKPPARPADLVQQTETVQETAQLGGYTRTQLAALRPKPRPYELRPPQNNREPEVGEEPAVAAIAPIGPTSEQAVILSSAPKHRPRGFARLVQRARASAPTERATAAAAVPRNQTVAPSAPSRASVARLATTKNAINLRRTSLIGVYGSPSKRRALVRLSNGRYVKVKVGERVDGGKVAAIGQSELRYIKGGRTIILRMPNT